ncbi:hypothetical protein SAMN05518801_105230 [Novosphingobium sp. CF614]|uniref:hypothetical protein n=1 Tax=Novosphingobium sp. CF614 TaxID=1884364 RepID=UPI0008F35E20|nr:hypothetical protein [Novosphingobium sp. CF614]SFG02023.1 hypothetical protein SAMN05518801_105230 [Novosphingobium sp. CF614]
MDVGAFLRFHRLEPDALLSGLAKQVAERADDVILLAGSLSEGLGNHRSDIDIYRVISCELSTQDPVEILDLGPVAADVETVSQSRVRTLLARLDATDSDQTSDPRDAVAAFSDGDIKLLHQMRIGTTLLGETVWRPLHSAIDARRLARLLLDRAVAWLGVLQIDLLGFLESGDDDSARPLLRQFRTRLGAALLAALGETNPAEKWQIRLLERQAQTRPDLRLPGGQSLPDLIAKWRAMDEVIGSGRAGDAMRALQNLRFIIVPWAQRRFHAGLALGEDGAQLPLSLMPADMTGDRLPPLRLDCQIQHDAQGLWVAKVAHAEMLYINPLAHELLLHFDGQSTRAAAAARLEAISDAPAFEIAQSISDFQMVLADRALI